MFRYPGARFAKVSEFLFVYGREPRVRGLLRAFDAAFLEAECCKQHGFNRVVHVSVSKRRDAALLS